MAQISPKMRAEVWKRDRSRCRRCGTWLSREFSVHSIHHRLPRGMGGSRDPKRNSLSNFALICGTGTTGCHGYIESNRDEAYRKGWLVHSWDDPALVEWSAA